MCALAKELKMHAGEQMKKVETPTECKSWFRDLKS